MNPRRAGVLLHPTSLPGLWGVGDLGREAEALLAWLQRGEQSFWQMLPVGPTDSHGSPYSGLSAFAGNPLLISPEGLVAAGLLAPEDLPAPAPGPAASAVDFPAALAGKVALLRLAFERFEEESPGRSGRRREAGREMLEGFRTFCDCPRRGSWLEDWALFCTLRSLHPGAPWWDWAEELAAHDPGALAGVAREHPRELRYHRFVQFVFESQWRRLRSEAESRGVLMVGDLPIYPALDSADVWAHRRLFQLDPSGRPLAVAGVPPDDFSASGQLWGNPLYDWQAMAAEDFSWWADRLAVQLDRFDLLRLDHFRGFEAFWSVPAGAETAAAGSWQPGPGGELFEALERALPGRAGKLPLVAENLGVITPQVEALRRRFRLPGTAVLQFAFAEDGIDPVHAPHGLPPDTVLYTGTHDNPPLAGWYQGLSPEIRRRVDAYCGGSGPAGPWALIRCVYRSPAELAAVPAQDLLGLGDEARMNTPGTADGNWRWRLEPGALTPGLAGRLAELVRGAGRTS